MTTVATSDVFCLKVFRDTNIRVVIIRKAAGFMRMKLPENE